MLTNQNKLLGEIRKSSNELSKKRNVNKSALSLPIDSSFKNVLQRFVSSFTTKLKTKKGDYIFERFDKYGEIALQDIYDMKQKAKNILQFEFRGTRASIKELKKDPKQERKEFNDFASGLATILSHIIKTLKTLNLPYRKLKSAVYHSEEISNLVQAVNNYLVSFPLKMCFVYDEEHHYYYFILPEFDLFILDVPVYLPHLYVPDFTSNTCWNLFARQIISEEIFDFEQKKLFQLVNRCTIPSRTLEEAIEAPKKLYKVVEYMCMKVRGLISFSEKTIFTFFMRIRLAKRLKQRHVAKVVMKSKFRYWCATFVKYSKERKALENKSGLIIINFLQTVIRKKKILFNLRKIVEKNKNARKLALAMQNLINKRVNKKVDKKIKDLVSRHSKEILDKKMRSLDSRSVVADEHNMFKFSQNQDIEEIDATFNTVFEYVEKMEHIRRKQEEIVVLGTTGGKEDLDKSNFERQKRINKLKEKKHMSNTSDKWYGFNKNESLKNLILSVGETLDILDLVVTSNKDSGYIRLKNCIGNICMTTHSKQYIRFCRDMTNTIKKKKKESLPDFFKCFGTGEYNKENVLAEVRRFSTICNNKWIVFLVNNFNL